MQLLDKKLLKDLSNKARQSARLRMNYNLHKQLDAPAQRLFNALEPGTVLPVHRHQHTDETYILVSGKISVLNYNNEGTLESTIELSPAGANFGVHIPAGQWHTVEVLESDTVIFEVKDGPYTPLEPEDIMQI